MVCGYVFDCARTLYTIRTQSMQTFSPLCEPAQDFPTAYLQPVGKMNSGLTYLRLSTSLLQVSLEEAVCFPIFLEGTTCLDVSCYCYSVC